MNDNIFFAYYNNWIITNPTYTTVSDELTKDVALQVPVIDGRICADDPDKYFNWIEESHTTEMRLGASGFGGKFAKVKPEFAIAVTKITKCLNSYDKCYTIMIIPPGTNVLLGYKYWNLQWPNPEMACLGFDKPNLSDKNINNAVCRAAEVFVKYSKCSKEILAPQVFGADNALLSNSKYGKIEVNITSSCHNNNFIYETGKIIKDPTFTHSFDFPNDYFSLISTRDEGIHLFLRPEESYQWMKRFF
ncbi:putative ORFan [Tupanvirus deep ocean]|uniref:ORFan n=2 Tax=Tupanvirus TaxID=2094720 RepID=A0AC62A9B9_9VIRU|nr:putative ORFan [Tupanvirus deep ocean]QKU34375.1 putative ORFan [Tupanvirus deep ocean]